MDKRTKEYKQWKKDNPDSITVTPKNIDNIIREAVKKLDESEEILPLFKVILKINDTEYTGEADTIADAIKLAEPPFFKTVGILHVFSGDRNAEKVFNVFTCKRLFINQLFRDIQAKSFFNQLN